MRADELLQHIIDTEIPDARICRDYSGRGMFGETCIGLICPNSEEGRLAAAGALGFRGARRDNMGRDWIIYWPDLKPDSKLPTQV